MPARKADLRITIETNGQRFSLNCERMMHDQYRVKRGRTVSRKMPVATLTEIFTEARKWAVRNA